MRVYELQQFGIDSLVQTERPDPQPGIRQVVIKVKAVSLNYRDLSLAIGQYNPRLKLPIIPISDGVGEIVAVGEGVSSFKIGDRVAGTFFEDWTGGEVNDAKARTALGAGDRPGMLAEYVVRNETGVIKIPEYLTYEEAATLPCAALTAWHALIPQGRIKAGDTVLILGTGGVSIFALQFAKACGARVIATSSSDEKLARVIKMGASDGINYKTTEAWDKAARELTGGVGVDHVVEVGGAGTIERSLRAVRMGGTVSVIGALSAGGGISPIPVLMKSIRVQGIFVGSREMFAAMNRALELHQIHPVIDRVFGFDDVQAAYKHLESGAHFGKVVINL